MYKLLTNPVIKSVRAAHRKPGSSSIVPEILGTPQLFQGISCADINAILALGSVQDFPRGSWLFTQGEPAREFFLLLSGRIRLHQVSAQGEDMLVRFIVPGATCAGIAVVANSVHGYSALSVMPTQIVAWPGSTGRELIGRYPRFALNLFAIAVQLLNCLQERCRQLTTQSVPGRIIWAVGELADTIGEKSEQGVLIDDPGIQRDLAELAGTTVYTVSRVLADLHQRGIIAKRRGHIVVRNYAKLMELRDAVEP
jgi:CRP-like cAMP-binding protein